MKTISNILAIAMLLLVSHVSNAQHVYPAAISTSGILFGKYKTSKDATNPIPDTISLSDAQDIFAINGVGIDKEKKFQKTEISEFQMTLVEQGKVTRLKGNSSMLTKEMKDRLNTIQSGTRLIFEGIATIFPNGETRFLTLLEFTVI